MENQEIPLFWNDMMAAPSGRSLAALAEEKPVLLVFLRFFGCSFCREAISDISKKRKKIEAKGVQIAFVHMAPDPELAVSYFEKYNLYPIEHISDPDKRFYRAFGLTRGTPVQIFGLMNWIRGFQATVLEGHGADSPSEELGDGFQMPGVFLVYKGVVLNSFVHKHPYDRPDYEEICTL
jgi:peroxiredoxin